MTKDQAIEIQTEFRNVLDCKNTYRQFLRDIEKELIVIGSELRRNHQRLELGTKLSNEECSSLRQEVSKLNERKTYLENQNESYEEIVSDCNKRLDELRPQVIIANQVS